MFVVINSRRDPIGHRLIRKEKGTVGDWTFIVEEIMHQFLAQVAGTLAMKLPPSGLWNRFIRSVLWGQHAQPY
jgi:hypothetical protein